MANIVLYQGGNRKAGFYALTLTKSVKRAHRTHISKAAFDSFGREDIEVLKEGVRLGNRTRILPSIFIRAAGNKNDRTHTAFIAKSERNEIGQHFDLPLNVLKERAFFTLRSSQTMAHKTILIKPIWEELLEPEWRDQMLDWAAGLDTLPFPSQLLWEIHTDNRVTLPALMPVLDCAAAKKGMNWQKKLPCARLIII
jgi:hypothetical protein